MREPKEVKTAEDRAEYYEQLKHELIADHNATSDSAVKRTILNKLKIVGYHGAKAREECGAAGGEPGSPADLKQQQIKKAAKSKRFKIEAEHKDIDYFVEAAKTRE